MSIDFPGTPVPGQTFLAAGRTWLFDGAKWTAAEFPPASAPEVPLVLHGGTMLPPGFDGLVWVDNTSGTAITITMPPSPVLLGQHVLVKDTQGNAGTLPITVTGGSGGNIEGTASLIIQFNFGWVDLTFTGLQWVQT